MILLLALKLTRRALVLLPQAAFAAQYDVPPAWLQTDDGLTDPVLGDVTRDLKIRSTACDQRSIKDFGDIDAFDLTLLGLTPGREKGDVVAAKRRTADDLVFYEWDLAIAPETCPKSELIVCLPDTVALVSATVKDGALYVLECGVSPSQWKNFAGSLRTLRSSFKP